MTDAQPLDTRTDGDHLLAAILAHPEDDDPRLRYADWLDEHARTVACPQCDLGGTQGSPKLWMSACSRCSHTGRVSDGRAERAEFIRVQIQLERWAENTWPDGTQHLALRRRERELLLQQDGGGLFDAIHASLPGTWQVVLEPKPTGHYPQAIVRRGFPAAVHLTLAAFMGGPCGRCENLDGSVVSRLVGAVANPRPDCSTCSGTGRTPGLAAELGRLPLESVRLTDREPRESMTGSGQQFIWFHDGDSERGGLPGGIAWSECLPVALFDLIEPERVAGSHWHRNFGRHSDKWFSSLADAHAALSRACLAFSRQAAGS